VADDLTGLLKDYSAGELFCELLRKGQEPNPQIEAIVHRLDGLRPGALQRRAKAADRELFNLGITFTVYTDKNAIDRVLPFDVIPRVLSAADWSHIELGCVQRVAAINQFLDQ